MGLSMASYAKRPFLTPVLSLAVAAFGRLRKDADLRPLPSPTRLEVGGDRCRLHERNTFAGRRKFRRESSMPMPINRSLLSNKAVSSSWPLLGISPRETLCP
jgi:hypothetical protein